MSELLKKVLALEEYKDYIEISDDDYRNPFIENASFSISSKGWYNHTDDTKGSLQYLLPQVNIQKIYDNSKEDYKKIVKYFKTRKIQINSTTIKLLGSRINIYKEQVSIVTPLYTVKKELIQLHVIKLNKDFTKDGKSRLLGKNINHDDRAIILKRPSKKFIVIEGLEDGLVVRGLYPDYNIVISCGAKQFKRVRSFLKTSQDTIVILDNDETNTSLKYSFFLGDRVKRLIPSTTTDPNKALINGTLDTWFKTLEEVTFEQAKDLNPDAFKDRNLMMDELNEKHAVISIQGKVCIMNDEYEPMFERWGVHFSSHADFTLRYSDRFLEVTDDSGNTKKQPISKIWLTNQTPRRRQYDGMVFDPSGSDHGGKYFNLWRGFMYEPGPGNCNLYYEHIYENIAQGNEVLKEYILDWLADGVQNLTNKPGIAFIIRGGQGTGKGVFINRYLELFGQHGIYIKNMSHLVGKFNAHFKECSVLFADEMFVTGDKAHEGVLKGLVSEDIQMIEYKGKDILPFKNFIRLMMSSNNDYVVPLDTDNRRYFIVDIGTRNCKDYKFFAAMEDQFKNENGHNALIKFLLERDLTGKNIKNFPNTQAIVDNKISSFNSVQEWIYGHLCTESLPPLEKIKVLYNDYCRACGGKRPETMHFWHEALIKAFPSMIRRQIAGHTGRYYALPDPHQQRIDFCKYMGMKIDFN